ncbi:MAG: aldehyde dehydrogenase [Desulfurococcales archaeon]|nr:aldehyde dehydrogenase [Desulfurococcales archaeon]
MKDKLRRILDGWMSRAVEERGDDVILRLYSRGWISGDPAHAFKDPYAGERLYYIPRQGGEAGVREATSRLVESSKVPYMSVHDRIEALRSIGEVLEDKMQSIASLVAMVTGKPLKEAEAEVEDAVEILNTAATVYDLYSRDLAYSWRGDGAIRWPWRRGSMLVYGAAPAPLFTTAHGLAHSIVLGMPAIVKPPLAAMLPAALLVAAAEEAGLGDSVAMVAGSGPSILDQASKSGLLDAVASAGSKATVASIIARAPKARHISLAADNSVAIICSGANIAVAAKSIIESRVQAAGRGCLATKAVIAEEEVAGDLVEALISYAETLKPGNPLEAGTSLGPINGKRRLSHMEAMIEDAVGRGAQVLYGGRVSRTLYRPVVLDHVDKSSKMLWEKSNVPIIPVVRVSSCGEALALAKALPHVDALLIYADPWHRVADEAARSGFRIVYVNQDLERPRVFHECHHPVGSPLLSYPPGRLLASRIVYTGTPLEGVEAEPYR